jgi:hypothetical protein
MSTSVIKILIRVVVNILVITKLGITMKSNTNHCTCVYVTQYICLLLKSKLDFLIKTPVISLTQVILLCVPMVKSYNI